MSSVNETPAPIDPLRPLWIGLGLLFVAIGFVGAFLPVLPSTEFFLLAAYFFARSSPRLYNWLLGLPKIGPAIRDYRSGLGMPRRAKVIALSAMTLAVLVSAIGIPDIYGKATMGVLGLIGFWYIQYKVPTREAVLAQRAARQQES